MTAKIKLNAASGGGSFSLQAPSSSANNRVITLPDIADGTLLTNQTAGTVLQVKNMIIPGEFSTTSATYADNGLTLAITPSATTSKILVLINYLGAMNTDANGQKIQLKILRDSTAIFTSPSDYMRIDAAANPGGSVRSYAGQFLSYLDSPSTTSSVTYKNQTSMNGGAGTHYLTNGSNMTLLEVAA